MAVELAAGTVHCHVCASLGWNHRAFDGRCARLLVSAAIQTGDSTGRNDICWHHVLAAVVACDRIGQNEALDAEPPTARF
jgi:hypothetical protein